MKKGKLRVLVWTVILSVAIIGAFITYLICSKILASIAVFATIVGIGISVFAYFIEKSSMGNLAGAILAIVSLIGTLIAVSDSNNTPFTSTIKVYGWEGYEHNPLNGKGAITLELNKPETVGINEQGIAVFTDIPPKYNDKTVSIHITDTENEPYYLTDSIIKIQRNSTTKVQVLLRGLEKLQGIVLDHVSCEGLPNVSITIAGIHTTTDAKGKFGIEIPIDKQQQEQVIEISKDGYENYEETIIMAGNYKKIYLSQKIHQ